MARERLSAIDTFLKNGGRFIVLRPVPDALDFERTIVSLTSRRRIKYVREFASQGHDVELVIATPDEHALVTVADPRWPKPVLVEELRLFHKDTDEGNFVADARSLLGNASIREYWQLRLIKELLLQWATQAKEAIEYVLRVRMIQRGRVVICGAEPFIGLLAVTLTLASVAKINWWGPLREPIYCYPGFTARLNEMGTPEVMAMEPPPFFQPRNVLQLPKKK